MKIGTDELNNKLREHRHWVADNKTGKKLDLRDADLDGAKLRYAKLRYADLRGADLRYADLRGADLRFADLRDADLRFAVLIDVNFRDADLRGADLCDTDLRDTDLRFADLEGAKLRYAELRGADLRGAVLLDTDLDNAYVNFPISCPTHGEFIAWKKVENKIIKLKILEDAKRLSATTNKCRCDKALVLAIENIDGTDSGLTEIVNENFKPAITYKVGEMVYPDSFDESRWNECSHGIHFFIDRKSAEIY